MNLRRNVVLALVAGATLLALAGCGKSSSVTAANPVLDPTPPSAPSTLSSNYVASIGYDYLYWNLSTSPSVTGYEVWESATQGGTATRIASVDGATSHVVLPAVDADCTRFYEVRATASGLASAFSAALSVDRHVIVSAQGGGSNGSGGGLGNRIGE